MSRDLQIRITLGVALGAAAFGLVSSLALAVLLRTSIADVTPFDFALHAWSVGLRPEVWSAARFGALAAVLAPLLVFARPAVSNFGEARFARRGEIRAAGLLSPTGLLLGRYGGRFLRSGEPLHVLVAAPTRSGKGVGIVVPNLLSWTGSALVLDIKYENHRLTSGHRKRLGPVFRFSPADPEGCSHRYNPLDAVRPGPSHRASDLQRLAAILIPPPPGMKESFWQDEARSLFLGLALYVLDTPQIPHTLGEIYRTLMSPEPLDEVCLGLLCRRDDLDPVCRMTLGSYAHKSEKERSGVRSTLTAALGLWANPVIDAATAASDFDLRDLRRTPMTIYVAVSLDQLGSVTRLLNLFFQQAVTLLAERVPGPDEPHRVLMMLDEFASLGRMDVLKDSLAFLAEFGVRICTVIQGLGQLDDLYGPAGRESILQNCALQVLFAANDETTARYVSERLGTQTIQTVSRSFPGGGQRPTKTVSRTGRALLLPEEVRQLGPEQALIFKEGVRPVLGRKIRYYADPAFSDRQRTMRPVSLVAAFALPKPEARGPGA
jgi:type IV secretion system protein VirD4